MFKGKSAGRDWSQGPVAANPETARYSSTPPDVVAEIEAGIAESRVDPSRVDKVDLLVRVWRVMEVQGAEWLSQSGHKKAVPAMEELASRSDKDTDMIWNFLTHWGPAGIAVQRNLSELFESGQMRSVIVQVIQEGTVDNGLVGRDKI